MSKIIGEVGQKAGGRFKVMIVDAKTQQVVEERPWKHNLIINAGMQAVGDAGVWTALFSYCIVGTGIAPNWYDSGTTTATSDASGNVSISGGSYDFTSVVAGDSIQWDTGQEGFITNVGSTTACTISPAPGGGGISAGEFTIYKTSRTLLQTEAKRTGAILPGAANNYTYLVGNVIISRRTFDFTAEVGSVTYTELGVGWGPSANTAVFARTMIPGSISLTAGQQLRVIYELSVALSPTSSVPVTLSVTGWPVAPATNTEGDASLQLVAMSSVNSSGVTSFYDSGFGSNEPSRSGAKCFMWISESATPLTAFGVTAPDRSSVQYLSLNWNKGSVVPGHTYYLLRSVTFSVAQINSNTWRSIGMHESDYGNYLLYSGFAIVLDQAQTKADTQTLTLAFRMTWGRTLVRD